MIADEDKYRGKVHDTCLKENVILLNEIDNENIFKRNVCLEIRKKYWYQIVCDFLYLRNQ